MKNSTIEWTDNTHNFWHGCTQVTPACKYCYAKTLSSRFPRKFPDGSKKLVKFGSGLPRWQPSQATQNQPLKWDKQAKKLNTRFKVFTLSMGDFFDDEVDPQWREDAWKMIKATPNLDWQILTKRPENIQAMLPGDWGTGYENVWLGITVENQQCANSRIPILLSIPAKIKFLSVEPLLEHTYLYLDGIDWVIVGGETGRTPRKMDIEWVRSIRNQCVLTNTPFFFKQWGGTNPKKIGRILDGREWNQFPQVTLTQTTKP